MARGPPLGRARTELCVYQRPSRGTVTNGDHFFVSWRLSGLHGPHLSPASSHRHLWPGPQGKLRQGLSALPRRVRSLGQSQRKSGEMDLRKENSCSCNGKVRAWQDSGCSVSRSFSPLISVLLPGSVLRQVLSNTSSDQPLIPANDSGVTVNKFRNS